MMTPLDQAVEIFMQCRTRSFYDYFVRQRRIPVELLDRLKLGWSPDHDALEWPLELRTSLMQLGLVEEGTGHGMRLYQKRFVIPVLEGGHVVNLVFRVNPQSLPAGQHDPSRYQELPAAVYLPFHPHRIQKRLYRIQQGNPKRATLVEGPIGAARCAQAGLDNPTGLLGLGYGPAIAIRELARLGVEELDLFLDWDHRGVQSALEVCRTALVSPFGLKLHVLWPQKPPVGSKDPSDLDPYAVAESRDKCRYNPEDYLRLHYQLALDPDDEWQQHALEAHLALLKERRP